MLKENNNLITFSFENDYQRLILYKIGAVPEIWFDFISLLSLDENMWFLFNFYPRLYFIDTNKGR